MPKTNIQSKFKLNLIVTGVTFCTGQSCAMLSGSHTFADIVQPVLRTFGFSGEDCQIAGSPHKLCDRL